MDGRPRPALTRYRARPATITVRPIRGSRKSKPPVWATATALGVAVGVDRWLARVAVAKPDEPAYKAEVDSSGEATDQVVAGDSLIQGEAVIEPRLGRFEAHHGGTSGYETKCDWRRARRLSPTYLELGNSLLLWTLRLSDRDKWLSLARGDAGFEFALPTAPRSPATRPAVALGSRIPQPRLGRFIRLLDMPNLAGPGAGSPTRGAWRSAGGRPVVDVLCAWRRAGPGSHEDRSPAWRTSCIVPFLGQHGMQCLAGSHRVRRKSS